MLVQDLHQMPYREAWAVQEEAHAAVLAGGEERILLVEHTPVVTLGRRPEVSRHLVASPEQLATLGVEMVQSDRGGDITFHGPGQLVAYPIVRLHDRHLSVGGYVRRLLEGVIATLGEFGVNGQLDPDAIGVWVPVPKATPGANLPDTLGKICALGVRIRRGVSLHGIALNVTTDLRYFNLIVPCGLTRPVTSLQQLMGSQTPAMETLKAALVRQMQRILG